MLHIMKRYQAGHVGENADFLINWSTLVDAIMMHTLYYLSFQPNRRWTLREIWTRVMQRQTAPRQAAYVRPLLSGWTWSSTCLELPYYQWSTAGAAVNPRPQHPRDISGHGRNKQSNDSTLPPPDLILFILPHSQIYWINFPAHINVEAPTGWHFPSAAETRPRFYPSEPAGQTPPRYRGSW